MRALFTSDWQVEHENIETCKRVVEEILRLKEVHGITHLVHCGDLKHSYNPVDVRVINFVIWTFEKFRATGLEVAMNLGNHDRIGMHQDRKNWLPILRRAGIEAFDKPGIWELGDGYEIRFLPFRTDNDVLARDASELAKGARKEKSVLVFHADIARARYNVTTTSDKGVGAMALVPERYMHCIGGHIHFQQRIVDNVFYVGSPFATDWGEANQRKGYLLVDFKTQNLRSIQSEIPVWLDPALPGFDTAKPSDWKGVRVRVKVPCADARSIQEELHNAKEKAEVEYRGAEVICIPVLTEVGKPSDGIQLGWSDIRKIGAYVEATIPETLKAYREKITKYLAEQVAQAGGALREGGELKFLTTKALNFLSFKKLAVKLHPGLCVVSGENRDWKGRSNGAGKSSCLQPIAVALFGTTFKGQKHDKWMRRGTGKSEKSFVSAEIEDSQNRSVTVIRSRQPKKLILKVNGDLFDSGNRPEQTQRAIEQITGYTWETLSNAIYVDQGRAHLMLSGTEAERKGFLAKLQNLERFEQARTLVKQDIVTHETSIETIGVQLTTSQARMRSLHSTIAELENTGSQYEEAKAQHAAAEKSFEKASEALKKWELLAEKERTKAEQGLEKERNDAMESTRQQAALTQSIGDMQDMMSCFTGMKANCPTCLQSVEKKYIASALKQLSAKLEKKKAEFGKFVDERDGMEGRRAKLTALLRLWQRNRELEERVERAARAVHACQAVLVRAEKHEDLIKRLREELETLKKENAKLEEKIQKIQKWLQVLDYAERTFSRTGLPAYLNAQILPQLNTAAQEYSELFSQKEIQVLFSVDEEGRIDVQVINAHGGENVQDQSEGEMKMASLITSFAVRSVAPKTNLLILDEPGDGLDSMSARHFARGLKEIAPKFGTILLTSHNPAILGELSSERMIRITKENGVSQIEQEEG